jgi:NAD(P)-dependent dehydrogenase (short-subunit alcohol dehydrogenase family)
MQASFAGRYVLVSGASSGIGRATALTFAGAGADLLLVARDAGRLAAAAMACREAGAPQVETIQADLTDDAAPAAVMAAVNHGPGRLDVLINSAGIIGSGPAAETSDAQFDRMLDVNVRSLFRLTRAAIPMLRRSRGSIVNVSSVAGLRPYPGILPYCVSKAAVDQMTRCLALELGPDGIRVNAVNPGVVVTNLHRAGGMDATAYAVFLERGADTHPLGRVGTAEEVAQAIFFLASADAAWITGTTLSVDGGRAQTSLR